MTERYLVQTTDGEGGWLDCRLVGDNPAGLTWAEAEARRDRLLGRGFAVKIVEVNAWEIDVGMGLNRDSFSAKTGIHEEWLT